MQDLMSGAQVTQRYLELKYQFETAKNHKYAQGVVESLLGLTKLAGDVRMVQVLHDSAEARRTAHSTANGLVYLVLEFARQVPEFVTDDVASQIAEELDKQGLLMLQQIAEHLGIIVGEALPDLEIEVFGCGKCPSCLAKAAEEKAHLN